LNAVLEEGGDYVVELAGRRVVLPQL
jgi:hypothetical protein